MKQKQTADTPCDARLLFLNDHSLKSLSARGVRSETWLCRFITRRALMGPQLQTFYSLGDFFRHFYLRPITERWGCIPSHFQPALNRQTHQPGQQLYGPEYEAVFRPPRHFYWWQHSTDLHVENRWPTADLGCFLPSSSDIVFSLPFLSQPEAPGFHLLMM